MWLISGPFDGKPDQVTKLLKTEKAYPLGRRDQPLVINSAKISRLHCEFVVGRLSTDDVAKPNVIPSLQFFNSRDKPITVMRTDAVTGEQTSRVVNGKAMLELEDGDAVYVLGDTPCMVKWQLVSCYCPPAVFEKSNVPAQTCASLGLHVTPTLHPSNTHFVVPSLEPNVLIATGLLGLVRFVKPEWLRELVRLGNLEPGSKAANGTALEEAFALPSETSSTYRPSLPSSPPSLKSWKTWDSALPANAERLHMFGDLLFLVVSQHKELREDMRNMISRGAGECRGFNIGAGKTKWRQLLAKVKAEKRKLVLVRDTDAAGEQWNELEAEADAVGLRFISREDVTKAILQVDVSRLDCAAPASVISQVTSLQPEPVQSKHPETSSTTPLSTEPTLSSANGTRAARTSSRAHEDAAGADEPNAAKVPPRRALTRRATSRQPSAEPAAPIAGTAAPPSEGPGDRLESAEPEAPPRKALTRRAKAAKTVIVGIDDPSIVEESTPNVADMAPPPPVLATPARSSRLKRRAGAGAETQGTGTIPVVGTSTLLNGEEPPLKRFRALYEESAAARDEIGTEADPDAILQTLQMQQSQAVTQAETQVRFVQGTPEVLGGEDAARHNATAGILDAVLEEEEEESQWTQSAVATAASGGAKRKSQAVDGDVDMNASPKPGPSRKKRATENDHVAQTQTQGRSRAGSRSGSKPPSGAKPPSAFNSRRQHQNGDDAQAPEGAEVGKPDRDEAFLTAVASKKKGRRNEDLFDKEFNNLRISKPELRADEEEKDWDVLVEFGDDTNIRGNFMVVCEMEIFRPAGNSATRRSVVGQAWEGKPDFKKFKKKINAGRREVVELFATEENEYDAYWKNTSQSQSQSQADGAFPGTPARSKSQTQGATRKQKNKRSGHSPDPDNDDDAEVQILPPARSKPTKSRSAAVKPKAKRSDLFLDSDDEVVEEIIHDDEMETTTDGHTRGHGTSQETPTLHSSDQGTRMAAARKAAEKEAKLAMVLDDDADDGMTFKGFGKSKKRKK